MKPLQDSISADMLIEINTSDINTPSIDLEENLKMDIFIKEHNVALDLVSGKTPIL